MDDPLDIQDALQPRPSFGIESDMRDNRSFYFNLDWLSCLIYCCHSGAGFYQQQLGAIKARFGAGTDYSRADWMIGKKMAMLGYPSAVIQATLDQCSPDIGERKKGHEDDYTRRTVKNIMQDIEVLRQRSKLAEILER